MIRKMVMRSKSGIKDCFVFLLIVLFINACSVRNTPAPNTATPFEVTSTITPTVEPLASDTPVSTITATSSPVEILPKAIVISLGSLSSSDTCLRENRAEIWIFDYPYDKVYPLLQEANTDYYFPRWSPSGEWIAYVSSKPLEIVDPVVPPSETGSDSIWVMRADGSDQHQISQNIPSLIIRSSFNGCFEETMIETPPEWSPDGRYIAFAQSFYDANISHMKYSYYYSDLTSRESQSILTQENYSSPVWINDGSFAIAGKGVIKIITIIEKGAAKIDEISFPSEIPVDSDAFVSARENDSLLISFRLGSTLISPLPKEISIWQLDISTESWQKLGVINKQTWGTPEFGDDWAILCDEMGVFIYDISTWETTDSVSNEDLGVDTIDCGKFKSYHNYDRRAFVVSSFLQPKIMFVDLDVINQSLNILFDLSKYPELMTDPSLLILDFDLKPVSSPN